MKSVWSDFSMPKFEQLSGDIKTDVLIVGGGLAGLLIAYELTNRGVSCVIAEAKSICSGATKNTTAKITSQHGLIYAKLIKSIGIEKARLYLAANEEALAKYRNLSKSISCDFENSNAFAFSQSNAKVIEEELAALEKLGFTAEYEDKTALPFSVSGAVKFKNQAMFHPLKFAAEIAKGLKIYEQTPVVDIDGHIAKTPHGNITAESIVIATHFPFINSHGMYFMKMYQERSYVTAINGIKTNGMYIDSDGLSFRGYGNLTLIGSGSHRTGKKTSAWKEAECISKRYYPRAKTIYKWANQDCITLDNIPYIGNYSKNTPYMYVATGFNKWGMTSSMVAASIIADKICGKNNEYADVFSPSRSIFKKQLAVNAFESATNILTLSAPRCPHLGCALKWNRHERTWDCPCHGSRFTEKGSLIDNPATKGLKRH